MVLEDLERKLAAHPEAKLMYVIPTFQNPTGKTWSLERRRGVLALAQRHGLPILEDNPYGDLRYEGQTVPTLKSMDTGGIVTYMGSFSKVLSPGLRLGWLIAPPELLEKYASAKECTDLQAGTLSQMVADAYLLPGRSDIQCENRTNLADIPQIPTDWDAMMEVATDTAAKLNEICQ